MAFCFAIPGRKKREVLAQPNEGLTFCVTNGWVWIHSDAWVQVRWRGKEGEQKISLDSTERWGLMQPVVYRGLQGLEVKGKGSQGIVDAWRITGSYRPCAIERIAPLQQTW